MGRYPRRGDRGTVRLRYNKVIVIVRLSVLFCLFALRFLHSKLFEKERAGKLCDRQLSPVGFRRCHFLNDFLELSRKVESKSARIFRLRRIAALSTTLHPASAEPYTLDTAEARCYPISGGVDHGSLQILPAVHQRRKSVIDGCDPP